ncbi:MAG: carboxypeptidase regulatory-like domain-containing protein [Acidobacteriota bacterium]
MKPLIMSVVILGVIGVVPIGTGSAESPSGRIKGAAMDVTGAVIPGATVGLYGKSDRWQTTTDQNGNYRFDAPPGIYEIRAEATGFLPFRRAPFRLESGQDILMNIRIIPSGLASHVVTQPPKIGEESFALPSSPDPSLILFVQFGAKQQHNDLVEYRGVMISYDVMTLYGDRARLNAKSLQLEVEGNVIVEDGLKRIRVRKATVEFRGGKPVVSLTRGAIDAAKGEGSIEGTSATFAFNVTAPDSGNVSFHDSKSGITFVSTSIYWFRVKDDAGNAVTFSGVGRINKEIPVGFTVSVTDAGSPSKDTFSIEFDGFHMNSFNRSGTLSSGKIELHRDY